MFSKTIVIRLNKIIDKIVSPYQTRFIFGRSIQENIVVAHDMVNNKHRLRGKYGYFALKVDLAKACDKMN